MSRAVVTDGLRDGEDMGFGESAISGFAAVTAGAEGDAMGGVGWIGGVMEVFVFKRDGVDENILRGGFTGEGMKRHPVYYEPARVLAWRRGCGFPADGEIDIGGVVAGEGDAADGLASYSALVGRGSGWAGGGVGRIWDLRDDGGECGGDAGGDGAAVFFARGAISV